MAEQQSAEHRRLREDRPRGLCAEAASGAFAITSRKRDLGQINQAEFIDARRALTDAQLNVTLVRAEYLARLAELEYAVGGPRRPGQESRS